MPLPAEGDALWRTYAQIAGTRPQGDGMMAALPLTAYEAWQRLSGVVLTAWELDTLLAMDRAVIAAGPQPKVK